MQQTLLRASWLDTKLGRMLAIADEDTLYLLEFESCKGLEREVDRLKEKTKSEVIEGITEPIRSIGSELSAYFEGKLQEFKTPLMILGTSFQKQVWEELRKIPFGEMHPYAEIAGAIGKPSSFRAVANAIGANKFAIVIPCHRAINTNGKMGGYKGGIDHKKWLLSHERME